jgi:16S rRNA (adenine1518-N6/adenine1519-N6)-dimethyltransferase
MGENLGQHFLQDESVADDMVAASSVSDSTTVLEIGPGKGILTKKLISQARRVIAVEKDPELAESLRKRFAEDIANDQLHVETGDIRDFSLQTLISEKVYSVVANIPYYITSDLIRNLLTAAKKPDHITVLVQKEVAQRIVAENGKHSRLSLFVHAYAQPRIVRTVQPNAFSPLPNVDSAILSLENISNSFFFDTNADALFELIRVGFQHKRKTIWNNLKVSYEESILENALNNCDVDKQLRPERLALKQWQCLLKALQ